MLRESMAALVLAVFLPAARPETPPNTLTPAEARAGWTLLWDGRTTAGWHSLHDASFPHDWRIHDGILTVHKPEGHAGMVRGDLITAAVYSNFELSVDFLVTPGANSGIKYFVDPAAHPVYSIGLEYQILDDRLNPDAKLGLGGDRTLGALYDLIAPPKDKPVRPLGEWNTARIVVEGAHCEHWLNGRKLFEFTRFTPQFRALVHASKFAKFPGYGEWTSGHILLQEHDGEVSFRNLKLRVLPPSAP